MAVPIPMIIGGVAAGVQALQRGISGARQIGKAKKLEQAYDRPEYRTPTEIDQYVNLAKAAYQDPRLPGQGTREQMIDQSTANAVGTAQRAAGSPAALAQMVAAATSQNQQARTQLALEAARMDDLQRQQYGRALQTRARYRDQEFDVNRMRPYQQAMAAAGALRQSGNVNLYNAVGGVGNVAMSAYNAFGGQGMGTEDLARSMGTTGLNTDPIMPASYDPRRGLNLVSPSPTKTQLDYGAMMQNVGPKYFDPLSGMK